MTAITWDDSGSHLFETGVDRGVLYVNSMGVPWNGLTSVSEKSSGGSSTPYYFDGFKYLTVGSPEEFGATISAYTYPDEFMQCDGTVEVDLGLYIHHQPRKPFSFTYRTKIGNDTGGVDYAYKIHLIYNAFAAPSTVDYKTISDKPDPNEFSWDITLTPPAISGFRPSGHMTFDSRTAHPGALSDLEDILYGTSSTTPRMPTFDEIKELIIANANISVVDNGDGTYTLTADDDALSVSTSTFTVDSPAVTDHGDGTFTITTT